MVECADSNRYTVSPYRGFEILLLRQRTSRPRGGFSWPRHSQIYPAPSRLHPRAPSIRSMARTGLLKGAREMSRTESPPPAAAWPARQRSGCCRAWWSRWRPPSPCKPGPSPPARGPACMVCTAWPSRDDDGWRPRCGSHARRPERKARRSAARSGRSSKAAADDLRGQREQRRARCTSVAVDLRCAHRRCRGSRAACASRCRLLHEQAGKRMLQVMLDAGKGAHARAARCWPSA